MEEDEETEEEAIMFREQVATVSTWFDRWTSCEQTVAMVALLRRVQPTQAKFLSSVIQRQLSDCNDLRRSEILANDPSFVASLATSESKEALVRDLLTYLPLLSPRSLDVKALYLALIPKVLKYTLENGSMMEEARQLLSYSLIHPAFSVDDRGLFSQWLHQFEEKLNSNTPTNLSANDGLNHHYSSSLSGSPPNGNDFGSWQPSTSPNSGSLSNSPSQGGMMMGNLTNANFQRIRRSNSLTPPVTHLHSDAWNSQEDLYPGGYKPRSLSLSSEVSPQGSLPSSGSGSEVHLDEKSFLNPGMKDVPAWLKSLRLHKYSPLFAHLTYDEMLELTEEGLEAQGVTKGARHKIVLSIGKLKERVIHLKQIYEEMSADRESLKNALNEVKWVLTTPIKVSGDNEENATPQITSSGSAETIGAVGSTRTLTEEGKENHSHDWQAVNLPKEEGNITSWIVRVLGKACELNTDIECEGLLVNVLDKCLTHDVFTFKQKRLLTLWRSQQAPVPVRRNSFGHTGHFHTRNHRGANSPGGGSGNKSRHLGPRPLNLHGQSGQSGPHSWTPSSSLHAMFMAKRPSLQDSILEYTRSPLTGQRTKSAPIPNFLANLSCSPPSGTLHENMSVSAGIPIPTTSASNMSSNMLGKLDFGPVGLLGSPTTAATTGGTSPTLTSVNSSTTGGMPVPTTSAMDITSRLESLCLSMTEAALGPGFNNY